MGLRGGGGRAERATVRGRRRIEGGLRVALSAVRGCRSRRRRCLPSRTRLLEGPPPRREDRHRPARSGPVHRRSQHKHDGDGMRYPEHNAPRHVDNAERRALGATELRNAGAECRSAAGEVEHSKWGAGGELGSAKPRQGAQVASQADRRRRGGAVRCRPVGTERARRGRPLGTERAARGGCRHSGRMPRAEFGAPRAFGSRHERGPLTDIAWLVPPDERESAGAMPHARLAHSPMRPDDGSTGRARAHAARPGSGDRRSIRETSPPRSPPLKPDIPVIYKE